MNWNVNSMLGTVGKLEKSTFQRYQVCANWNFFGRVMAPGSGSVQAIFLRFSGEDSGQTGDVTDELRIARRSQGCLLS